MPLFVDLAAAGFDQIPTGSNYGRQHDDNFEKLVNHVRTNINPDHVLGFLQTPWLPTLPKYRDAHLAAIAGIARARR